MAAAISASNGVLAVAVMLAKRGMIDSADAAYLHDMMSKPLGTSDPAGDNTIMATLQQNLDAVMAEIGRLLTKGG
jgi:hypothetical protein